jgi:hypothetical protein
MEQFQIQQRALNRYEWFVAGVAPTLHEAFEAAEAMVQYSMKCADKGWIELRVVEPTMRSYIRD